MQRKIAVILPPPSTGAPQTPRQYPICALRKYSLYFDVLLSERWLKLQYNDNSPPAVDLSHTDLDPVACTSVLRFMVSRARSGGRDGESEDTKNGDGEHEEVTTEELKELLWDGFKWEQKDTTPNDEEKLYQVVDYLHVRHQDEILTKLWAIKMVQCPCSLEETLKKRDLVGRRRSLTDDDEEEEVYVKRVPEYRMTERMWRFLVCLFICQMLKEDEQYSTANHGRRMGTYNVLNQLSSLCSGLPENPLLLLRECVSIGLLSKEGAMYHQQTSVESQAVLLWKLLE
ncbi:hypothetical protein ACHAXT_005451 [Thalassiosira profunda]